MSRITCVFGYELVSKSFIHWLSKYEHKFLGWASCPTLPYSRDYTPRQNRFCTLCNNAGSAQTGDEFHAIMHCPSFAAQRENLRDKVAGHAPLFNKLNEYEQFIFLLTCEGAPACHMGEFSYNVLSAVRKPVWGLNLINTCLSVYDVYIAICWFSLSFCCYVS